MTILVVDDDTSYRFLLRNALLEEQWTVYEAEHGDEALEKLNSVTVDLIVSDVYMPIMDGIKFHKALRSIPRWETIPFLFVSAYDDNYTLEAIKNSRIEGFVQKSKPVSFLKQWIVYLTTPESMRPKTPPTLEGKPRPDRYATDRGRGNTRTPIL